MHDHVLDLLRSYGVNDVDRVRDTASEHDRTYLVDTARGGVVLKESPAGSSAAIMQAALLGFVAEHGAEIPVPRLYRNGSSGLAVTVTETGTAFVTNLIHGVPLEDAPITAAVIDDIVGVQSQLLLCLREADADRLRVPASNDWSIDSVLRYAPLIDAHAPVVHRSFMRQVINDFRAVVTPRLGELPAQVIHGDFNLSNLLVADGAVAGVIDFGDAVNAPRVYDIAVTACYLALALGDLDHPLVQRYVTGMTARCAVTDAELAVLRTLVLARVVIVVVLARESARIQPERAAYVLRYDALAQTLLDRVHVTKTADATDPEMSVN